MASPRKIRLRSNDNRIHPLQHRIRRLDDKAETHAFGRRHFSDEYLRYIIRRERLGITDDKPRHTVAKRHTDTQDGGLFGHFRRKVLYRRYKCFYHCPPPRLPFAAAFVFSIHCSHSLSYDVFFSRPDYGKMTSWYGIFAKHLWTKKTK